MIPIEIASSLLVGLLAFWLLGGLCARVGGLLLILVGAASLALYPGAQAALLVGGGAAIWLLGHWHCALRHHAYKSPLARYVFCRWAPAWLDPARNWAVPVVGTEPTDPERRPT
jgi:type IV secretory pathway TrbD component